METLFHPAVFWSLLIGLPLLPLLIHLINMLRHRRVQWAAMEFLLASHRRHRTSVRMKQILLLLARMTAIALLVLLLGQAGCRSTLSALWGGRATHHYVLLDDSYSMSDRAAGSSAFDEARGFLAQLASAAAAQNTPQKITLLRYSRASGLTGAQEGGRSGAETGQNSADRQDSSDAATETSQAGMDSLADLNGEPVTADFDVRMEERTRVFQPTELAVGPREALAVVRRLVQENDREKRRVYLVSDFRSREWDNPAEIRDALEDLSAAQAEVLLVSCAWAEHPNLGIVEVAPAQETRAAGVPLFVTIKVRNFGTTAVRKIPLKVRSVFHGDSNASRNKGEAEELPTLLIDEIRPGETASRQAQVFFARPGRHVVEAILPEDAVAADNRRWCVIDFPEGEPVLVIDGSVEQRHAYFLESAFQPGQRTITGVRPEAKTESFLRDASPEALRTYAAIYLLDVGRLDARAIENLEQYARDGGGVAFFLGEQVSAAFYNERLYRAGEGLFPLPLGPDALLPPEIENTPDILMSEHPVFGSSLGERNPLIRLVNVQRYFTPQKDWSVDPNSTVRMIARLRNQSPLAVERQFGAGRVVAFLTTLAPDWNNWAKNPSFVVTALKLQSHLAAARRQDEAQLAGAPLDLQLETRRHLPNVTFTVPGEDPAARETIERLATKPAEDSPVLRVSLGRAGAAGRASGETNRSGVYEAWLKTTDGAVEARRFAVNVEPVEGDLSLADTQALAVALEPVASPLIYADEFSAGDQSLRGDGDVNRLLALFVLCALAGLLMGEQLLAYSASYHPARGAAR